MAQSCPTLHDPMDCNTPGFPVHHQLRELAQTHVHPPLLLLPSIFPIGGRKKKKPTSITSVHKLIIFNVILKDKPLKECLMELDFFLIIYCYYNLSLHSFILSPWNIQSLLRFYSTVFSLNPYPAHFKDPFCESVPPFPRYLEFSTSSVGIFFNWALRCILSFCIRI